MITALGLALLGGCGSSLPDWVGDVPLESFSVPEPGEIHVESPAEPVQDALIAGGWQPWPGVTEEFLVDSHVLRLERDGVWADLRTTDTGVRLLKLDTPPEAQPVSAIDLATAPEPVSGDLEAQLPSLLGCQTQHGERADVVLRAGRYQWSRGRIVRNGDWTLTGDTLALDPPWAVTCSSVAGIGKGIAQLVTCGAADLLWCGGLAPGPTIALVVDDVAAARTDPWIGRIAALANRPLEDVAFPGDAVVFLAAGTDAGDGHAKNAVRLRYATSVPVPRAAARGPDRSYAQLAERLAYRIRRDLGGAVTVEAVDDPAKLRAGIAIHAVVGGSDDVTTGER